MKERPILFSGEMVRAILEGRKSQTRRVVKFKNTFLKGITGQVQEHHEMKACYPMPKGGFVFWSDKVGQSFSDRAYRDDESGYRCPYGEVGDRLWVRETWRAEELESGLDGVRYAADDFFRPIENTSEAADAWGDAHYDKHGRSYGMSWRPSIFMPRWASRIILEVVKARVERVQDISEADAWAEGITVHAFGARAARFTYEELWDKINAERGFGWGKNPWTWAVEFRKVEA